MVHSDHMVVSFHPSRNGADNKNAGSATSAKASSNADANGEGQKRVHGPAVSERSIRMVEATGRVNIEKKMATLPVKSGVLRRSKEDSPSRVIPWFGKGNPCLGKADHHVPG